MLPHIRRLHSLPRYTKIVVTFARYGFGALIEQLNLDRYLALPRYLLRKPENLDAASPAERLVLALEELGPTFIKLGQIAGTRADLLPAEIVSALARLQDQVSPEPWENMHAMLIEACGPELDSWLTEIDPHPLGSASLSQVHAGKLIDGSAVVLKIQRPGSEAIVQADLEILLDIAGLAERAEWGQRYHPLEIINQFAFTLRNEMDFRLEAANADRFRTNFADEAHLYIPKIYWEYSNQRVLVEERLEGIKIDDAQALDRAGFDRARVAEIAAAIVAKEVFEDGFFHADPHPGNFFVMRDDVDGEILVGAMDFGMVGYISRSDRLNLLQAFMLAARMDAGGLVEHLMRVGAVSPHAELDKLEHDLDHLLDRYMGLSLQHIYTRQLIEELMQLAYIHQINLPADFWLLFKMLSMMDGLARRLDPEINILSLFSPPVKRLIKRMSLPWNWGPNFMGSIENLAFALRDSPLIMERLLRGLQRGELPISFKAGVNRETLDRIDRVSTRLSISLLVAAFIIGTAVMFPVARDSRMAMALLVVGFILSLALGMWFIIATLRGGKK